MQIAIQSREFEIQKSDLEKWFETTLQNQFYRKSIFQTKI